MKSPAAASPAIGEGASRPPGPPRVAHVGVGGLAGLAVRLGLARVRERGEFDAGRTICAWARAQLDAEGASQLDVSVLGKHVSLVGSHALSHNVLSHAPNAGGGRAARAKMEAMSFLAPHALTIAHDESWTLLRLYNERVLGSGGLHPLAQPFLGHVRRAFARPPLSPEQVREAMGRAMLQIVLGDSAAIAPELARDVVTLFGVVQHPVRRRLLGRFHAARRRHLYTILGRAWDAARAEDASLIALARTHAPSSLERETLLEQVPHWMFTFTGSGTDLLVRTLAMITSNPGVQGEVVEEIRRAGPLDRAGTIEALSYLHACVLETGRLFPPVTRTLHASSASRGQGTVLHWFPLLQRDERLGHAVHGFRPERWLGETPDPAAAESNLFLRGPRACPGMALILFVCKAALARMIAEQGLAARNERLMRDPLPVSFPRLRAPFTTSPTPQ